MGRKSLFTRFENHVRKENASATDTAVGKRLAESAGLLAKYCCKCSVAVTGNSHRKGVAFIGTCYLAQIVLFNRRRGGEAQRLLYENYRHQSHNANDDVARGLSVLEQKLINKFTKMNVIGKRGRTVPILLTATMQSQLELLMKLRDAVGVPSTNRYVFAQPNSDSCLRSSDCLRQFAALSGADQPSLITSTRLRKHVATMSQIMNLKKMNWICWRIFWVMICSFTAIIIDLHKTRWRWRKSPRFS
jgi:hypothetical protein